MVHDPLLGKKKERRIPVTIAAKVSSSKTNKNIHKKYTNWLYICKFWKQLLNIPEIIPKRGENECMFCKHQEAEEVEVEY